jgi:1,4-alpha-glucan branching enzyme
MTKKKDGSFSIDVNLPKDSQHEFKYLVDKKNWLTDPGSADIQNVFGTTNSVLSI